MDSVERLTTGCRGGLDLQTTETGGQKNLTRNRSVPRGSALLLPQLFDVELKIAPSRAWHVGVKKTAIGVW